jgi:hypothetical protein
MPRSYAALVLYCQGTTKEGFAEMDKAARWISAKAGADIYDECLVALAGRTGFFDSHFRQTYLDTIRYTARTCPAALPAVIHGSVAAMRTARLKDPALYSPDGGQGRIGLYLARMAGHIAAGAVKDPPVPAVASAAKLVAATFDSAVERFDAGIASDPRIMDFVLKAVEKGVPTPFPEMLADALGTATRRLGEDMRELRLAWRGQQRLFSVHDLPEGVVRQAHHEAIKVLALHSLAGWCQRGLRRLGEEAFVAEAARVRQELLDAGFSPYRASTLCARAASHGETPREPWLLSFVDRANPTGWAYSPQDRETTLLDLAVKLARARAAGHEGVLDAIKAAVEDVATPDSVFAMSGGLPRDTAFSLWAAVGKSVVADMVYGEDDATLRRVMDRVEGRAQAQGPAQ